KTFVPLTSYALAMEFSTKENLPTILSHAMFGLSHESLIEEEFLFGNAEHLKAQYQGADAPGILFSPSALGVELFFWAHGKGNLGVNELLNPATQLTADININTAPGIRSTVFP